MNTLTEKERKLYQKACELYRLAIEFLDYLVEDDDALYKTVYEAQCVRDHSEVLMCMFSPLKED